MFLRNIFEALERTGQGKSAVIGWGRGMGHKGHMFLASSVITQAKETGGDPYFVVSKTVGKDDPINPDEKLAIYKKVFPQSGHIFQTATDEMPDLTRVLTKLNQMGYTDATVVVGADQVNALGYVKNYNGKPDKAGNIPFSFNTLNVISRQETNDPSRDQEGPRATPMRAVLMDPAKSEEEKFAVWRDAMNPELSDDEVMDLMHKAEQRMRAMVKPKKKGAAEGIFDRFRKKQQNYGGIDVSVEKEDNNILVKATANGRELGRVLFTPSEQDDNLLVPLDLEVDERYRGQGIGTTMYDYVKNLGYTIRRSQYQTDAGAGFWDKHKSGKNVWEQGVAEAGSNAMATTASRLSNKDDGKVAKLRAAGDKRREDQLKGRDMARRDRTSKDEWGNLKELSNDALGRYKKAAGADATAADKAGDFKRADKRFSSIVKATKKQFANDAKGQTEEKQRLDPSCWKGYKKQGSKMKGGVRVNNCVKVSESVENIMDALINKIITNEATSNSGK